jgi:PPOX class probable F420-dependent enzyme
MGVSVDEARAFLGDHHRGVLVTRRQDGRLQTSPVSAGVDDEGRVVISTREPSAKARNLRRDPWATLNVFTDDFFGPWVQVEGTAEVVPLPEALELLVDYYRRLAGEHPDWAEYRQAMIDQQRVVVRFPIESASGQL